MKRPDATTLTALVKLTTACVTLLAVARQTKSSGEPSPKAAFLHSAAHWCRRVSDTARTLEERVWKAYWREVPNH